jgi:hypothetical protein
MSALPFTGFPRGRLRWDAPLPQREGSGGVRRHGLIADASGFDRQHNGLNVYSALVFVKWVVALKSGVCYM